MSSRPDKDIGGWAASTSTSYDDDEVTRKAKTSTHDESADPADGESSVGEMDWTRLGEVLKRGRVKDRIHELNKIENIATKGGKYKIVSCW